MSSIASRPTDRSTRSSDGTPDDTFGVDGLAKAQVEDTVGPYDMVVQSDGKIVLVGTAWRASDGRDSIALVRFNSDGTLDDDSDDDGGFGTDGAGTLSQSLVGSYDYGRAVAIDADEKIVVGGSSYVEDGFDYFSVSRFTATGELDETFGGGDGYVTTLFFNDADKSWAYIQDIAIDSDGKIVAAGYVEGSDMNFGALARYNSDGSIDTAFGDEGTVASALAGGDTKLNTIAIQSDGKIVVASIGPEGPYVEGSVNVGKIARYSADGTLDAEFGEGGIILQDAVLGSDTAVLVSYDAAFAAVQSDGKILVALTYDDDESYSSLALVRFLGDGTPDAAE